MRQTLTRLYSRLNDRLPTTRRLEATGHIASWLAVSLTALMVGTAMAAEANPVAAWLIDTLGMRGFAVLTPVLVSIAFRLIHRFGGRAIGSVVAGTLVLDAVGNVLAVSHAGLPETVRWGELGLTTALVALLAVSFYIRLGSTLRAPDLRQLGRVTTVVLILVLSVSTPFYGVGLEPIGISEAASDGILDDFEDGDVNEWSNSGIVMTSTSDSTYVYEGQYAGLVTSSGNGDSNLDINDDYYNTTRAFVTPATLSGSSSSLSFTIPSGSSIVAGIDLASDGSVYAKTSSGAVDTGTDMSLGETYNVSFAYDYTAETYELYIDSVSQGEFGMRDGSNFDASSSGIGDVLVESGDVEYGIDYISTGESIIPTYNVNGEVETQDSTSIENANITVTQSSSTVTTTTTNDSGYYSVDLEDGNYTVEANADGYYADSQSVEVSGSAVSGVDFSIRDADQQEVEIQVIDYTNQSRFSEPSTLSVATEGSENRLVAATSFNTFNRTDVWLYPREYDFIVTDGETGATYHAERNISDGQDQLLLQPGLNFSVPELSENESVQVTLNQTSVTSPDEPDEPNTPDVTEETYVTVVSEEPVREFNYTIRNDTGDPVYNGTCSGPVPTTYCQDQVPEPVPNVSESNSTDGLDIDYDGEFANGSTFNGSSSFGSIEGGIFGPTGTSGGGSGGSTLVGAGILAGGAVLAYSRFGSRSIPELVSAGVSAAGSAVGRLVR